MSRIKDITNQRFGKLVVIRPTDKRNKKRSVIWECKCDCGNTKFLHSDVLKSGAVISCGCHRSSSKEKILTNKLNKNNISGFKGISYDKTRGAWRSTIRYKYRQYFLLRDKDINNCIAIRKEAENAVRDGNFEEWIANYKSRMTV